MTDVCVGLATVPFSVGKAISVYYPLGSLTEKGDGSGGARTQLKTHTYTHTGGEEAEDLKEPQTQELPYRLVSSGHPW